MRGMCIHLPLRSGLTNRDRIDIHLRRAGVERLAQHKEEFVDSISQKCTRVDQLQVVNAVLGKQELVDRNSSPLGLG
jgi:hypothetical protein